MGGAEAGSGEQQREHAGQNQGSRTRQSREPESPGRGALRASMRCAAGPGAWRGSDAAERAPRAHPGTRAGPPATFSPGACRWGVLTWKPTSRNGGAAAVFLPRPSCRPSG